MKKFISIVFSLVLCASFASAGIIRYSARKAAPVVKPVAKVAVFPVRHPKKTSHGSQKALLATAKAVKTTGRVAGKVVF
jgi:hypothetical protein